ncbi:MAG: precorrin-6Y C5,15-methyltransferase (decarboxylating) subunit CbiT, partial [Phormidesmis priestleyi]
LPLIGLPDAAFIGFRDRPALITKREIRLLILGELAPLPGQTIWDIGAGTGSISIELTRLCPTAQLYAIEKTAIGTALIHQNAQRLAHSPVQVIQGQAPAALMDLPKPDRVFIGGSSGQLVAILDFLHTKMSLAKPLDPLNQQINDCPTQQLASGRIVLALATLEHLSQITAWARRSTIAASWQTHFTQVNISRSLPVGPLTRFLPLTPITLVILSARSAFSDPKPIT